MEKPKCPVRQLAGVEPALIGPGSGRQLIGERFNLVGSATFRRLVGACKRNEAMGVWIATVEKHAVALGLNVDSVFID